MHTISKEVYFCYGHRLMNHQGKCKNIHGHSVKAVISISRQQLDEGDMVCDFADLQSCAEAYINETLDHNLLLHQDDRLIPLLAAQNERFLRLDQHPTAEVISKMIYQHIKNAGLPVCQVVLWETASSSACYTGTPSHN